MTHSSKMRFWVATLMAGLCLVLLTGLTIEKAWREGIPSISVFCVALFMPGIIAYCLHVAVMDVLSFSWRALLRAPVALTLAGLGFCVTLPQSIGSTGSARDVIAAKIEAANDTVKDTRDELQRLTKKIDWAEADRKTICEKRSATRCQEARDNVQAFYTRRDTLKARAVETPPVTLPVAPGEDRIVWAASKAGYALAVEDVSKGLPMVPPLVLEMLIAFFTVCASMAKRGSAEVIHSPVLDQRNPKPVPEFTPRRKKQKTEHAETFAREYLERTGHPPPLRLIQGKFKLAKSSASRARRHGLSVSA